MQVTRVCYECKQSFRKTEMTEYASTKAKIAHWYCPNCLEQKISRDNFSDNICQIFGIKAPGPRIWTERKRLQKTYGYTDDTIIRCLRYVYDVKHFKQLNESLALVKPSLVNEMEKYEATNTNVNKGLAAATNMNIKEYIVPIRENKDNKIEKLNMDDFLDN